VRGGGSLPFGIIQFPVINVITVPILVFIVNKILQMVFRLPVTFLCGCGVPAPLPHRRRGVLGIKDSLFVHIRIILVVVGVCDEEQESEMEERPRTSARLTIVQLSLL